MLPDCPHGRANRLPAPRSRVISASKRTDIPAFYLRWLIERCQTGWVDVPNPLFRHASDPLKRLTHVSLRPEHVVAIVWWSKNYAVYERLHAAFARYPVQYFQFTVTSRRPDLRWLEPDVPPLDEAIRQMRFLAGLPGGPGMVAWRYDPICFWAEGGKPRSSWDAEGFERMCGALTAIGVRCCFTSLADRYVKFEQRVKRYCPGVALRNPDEDEIATIAAEMATIATANGMALLTCSEPVLARHAGFAKGACIDGALLGASRAAATDRKMPGREECGCTLHTDIGDYESQPCGYACLYCYQLPVQKGERNADLRSRIEG
ncbi:MAG: DUF1848 family protein [Chloroflexi bacterium]|nr:DUF1848 family protein [Chloroflexota bacterium]